MKNQWTMSCNYLRTHNALDLFDLCLAPVHTLIIFLLPFYKYLESFNNSAFIYISSNVQSQIKFADKPALSSLQSHIPCVKLKLN